MRLDQGWWLDQGQFPDFFAEVLGQITTTPRITLNPKRTKTMDSIPRSRSDRYLWLKNIRDKIESAGPKIGLTPAEIAEIKATAADQCASMEADEAANRAVQGDKKSDGTSMAQNNLPWCRMALQAARHAPIQYPAWERW